MVPITEVKKFVLEVLSCRAPQGLFRINTLNIATPQYSPVKIGTRDLYVDFPRIAWILFYNDLLGYVRLISSQLISREEMEGYLSKNPRDIQKLETRQKLEYIVSHLLKEKDHYHPLNTVQQLTQCLNAIGLSWTVLFNWWFKRPVIRLYFKKRYYTLWANKLLNFIKMLNSGNDAPSVIYKMASEMSIPYRKYFLASYHSLADSYWDFNKRPEIFKMLERNVHLSIPNELNKLYKSIETLYELLDSRPVNDYDVIIASKLESLFSDMWESLHQLAAIYESGHYVGGYSILRHLILDLGKILLNNFISEYSSENLPPLYPMSEEEFARGIQRAFENSYSELMGYLSEFPEKWVDSLVVDSWGVPHLKFLSDLEKDNPPDATDLRTFCDKYKKGDILEKIKGLKQVKVRDRALYELVDAIIYHNQPAKVIIQQKQLPPKDGIVTSEYKKLSNAVHNPLIVDFPPYSSTFEYFGFLHHLKIVNKIFEGVVRVYQKNTSKREK